MLKIIRSLYTFYLNHFFVGLCISLSCVWMYRALGNPAAALICWFKLITMVIFFFAVNTNKKKEFFYFQNLGISKKMLWGVTLGIDALLFILLMTLTHIYGT